MFDLVLKMRQIFTSYTYINHISINLSYILDVKKLSFLKRSESIFPMFDFNKESNYI